MTTQTTPRTATDPIVVAGLTKTWSDGTEAVKAIDFRIAHGEVFGLLGPNGAGKSTTIGMLTTTVLPTSGSASVDGHDVARRPVAARSASAVVFQDAVVDKALSGRRNLEIHSRLWGVAPRSRDRRIAEHIADFGLDAIIDRPVATYSGGQRRRLEIARALLSEPRVLFLDEPTVGLDPRIRHELLDLIAALRQRSGMTVLLTTHYLDEAERLCDRVGIMHAGRIVALDSPQALLARLGDEVFEMRVPGDSTATIARLEAHGIAVADALVVGNTITLPVRHRRATELAAEVAALDVAVIATSTRKSTLDDVYLRLTGSALAA